MKLNIKAKLMLKWYRIDKRIQVQVGVILDTIRNSSEDSNPKYHLMTQLKKLWDLGEVEKWYEENKDEIYNISNVNILEQQVQRGFVDVRVLKTTFFSRRQLEDTFLGIDDFRKIV